MAFGKTASCLILASALWGADVKLQVRHEHLRKGCEGTLTVMDSGLVFTGAKKHTWSWRYRDIQELKLTGSRLVVLTYEDRVSRLGADRSFTFTGEFPRDLYTRWAKQLDQRFVAGVADADVHGWSLYVKHLRPLKGSEGTLTFGGDHIVYATDVAGEARTWRYSDIANISSSGPFQLTITTYERARSQYGDRKGFNFQLKEALAESRYNQLWLEIEQKNGRIQR